MNMNCSVWVRVVIYSHVWSCMVMLVHVWSCHTWSCVLMKGISCLAMFGLVGSYKGMLGHVWSFMVM